VTIGLRQKLIVLIFSGLFVAMAVIGTYRYFTEKQNIINTVRVHGEQSSKLLAELVGFYMQAEDLGSINTLVVNFMKSADVQTVTIVNREGQEIVHRENPWAQKLIALPPQPIRYHDIDYGRLSISVYPENLEKRLRAHALGVLIEYLVVFGIVAGILIFTVTRSITSPIKHFVHSMNDLIERKDFTRRVGARGRNEIGDLANGINYLIERLEQFIVGMGDIAARINELSPTVATEAREVRKNAEGAAEAISNVSSSVTEMSSSIHSFSENAESLSSSAEETSSAILQMNASNQEVARHTNELAASVEDVTASVTEMIASIREVAGHIENLSSATEETSASAIQIEATVREVERAAKESATLSLQASREAQNIGVRSIHETMNAIDTIKGAVTRYSDLVTRLGKRSEEIGKILGVIVEVTERTNLLALNASILAAQAGEHGRGFAVVAEEIKALADRTAGSAQDIAKLITAVQKEARDAVTAMADSLTAVEEGVLRSQEAGVALDKILASSTRSAEMATMIERAMTEQARGIKQVSEAIANVKQMSAQIASATYAQTKGTELIQNSAEGMRDIARQVQNAMAEQERGGKQIAAAADNVTMRAGEIAGGTREQQQSIKQILEAIERIQDLPRQSVARVESLAVALDTLGGQAELLNQELVTMTVRRGRRYIKGGTLKLGVMPLDAPVEMYRRFTPLTDYLSRAMGRRVEVSVATDFAETLQDFEEGKTDLAFLTPTTYIEAQRKFGALLLVKALRAGVPYTHAVIVARANAGITRLEDIKGKRFAFGDKLSTSGSLIPRALLAEAGVNLHDLQEVVYLGYHDAVAMAILSGRCDAGGLRESTARTFEDRGLVVIKTSTEIPEYPICASKHLDRETSDLVKKALLGLDRKDPAHAAVLSMIDQDYSGFVTATDDDYDGIRKMMNALQGTGAPS
jgi:phosphate/phosphite/phosphonate ABC transporter binding protein